MPRLLAALLAAFLLLAVPAVAAADADADGAPVGKDQQAAIMAVLQRLHHAYEAKDLKVVMGLIAGAVDRTAKDYAASHPERPDAEKAIRDAFQAFHEDIFVNEAYHVLEFKGGFATFSKRLDGDVEVVSTVPVISTDPMTFYDGETPQTVVLRLGRFVMREGKQGWQIMEMDLF